MANKGQKKGKGFFEKHSPIVEDKEGSFVSKDEIKRRKASEVIRGMELARRKYHMDVAQAERNLTQYLEITDPIIAPESEIEGPILWVRRPTMVEIQDLTPTREQMEYMESPEKRGRMPKKLLKEYEERFYEKFSELVEAPKKKPQEWRNIMTPWLLRLFWGYIAKVGDVLSAEVEGF